MSICPRVGGLAEYLDRLRIEPVLHRAEERSAQDAQQGAAARRSGRAVPGPGQGSDQGRPARRHAVRGARLPLHRPGRRPQHSAAAQVSGDGQGRRRARCCCTSSPKRGTASSRPPKTRSYFHTPAPFDLRGRSASWRSRRARRGPTPTWPARRSVEQMRSQSRASR